MTRTILVVLALCASPAFAAPPVEIERDPLGSGTPSPTVSAGMENATPVNEDEYHAPQYMPGYPTAATIWPRVVTVPCTRAESGALLCEGYRWTPALGRGEYLFFTPAPSVKEVIVHDPVVKVGPVPVPQPYPVYVEVPRKKKGE